MAPEVLADMDFRRAVLEYRPTCEQERVDREMMLAVCGREDILLRSNLFMHFTASGWITCPARDRVLLCWHNIYKSWSWTGGHADGEGDLLAVALREAREETGLTGIRPVREAPVSLEIIGVQPHFKRGSFVPAHLHLNLTYLLEADPAAKLRVKPDENSGLKWMAPDEAVRASSEECMRVVYEKLNKLL